MPLRMLALLEFAKDALFFLVRDRTSAVLEDAVEASPSQSNNFLQDLCLLPPVAARLIMRVKSLYHPGEGI